MKLSELIKELKAIQRHLAETGLGDIEVVTAIDSNCTFAQGDVDQGIDFMQSSDYLTLVSYMRDDEDIILTWRGDSDVIE